MIGRGRIGLEFTAWCGICPVWDRRQSTRLSDAKRAFRRLGWKQTRKFSWLCPGCAKDPAAATSQQEELEARCGDPVGNHGTCKLRSGHEGSCVVHPDLR